MTTETVFSSGYHHGDVRNACLKAGMEIIAEQGIHQLNLRSVAKKVGISHNAPYRTFKNKEALVVELTILIYNELRKKITPIIDQKNGNVEQVFYALAKAFFDYSRENKEKYRVLSGYMIEDYTHYPELQSCVADNFELIHRLVQSFVSPEKDSVKVVTMCIATLHGFCSLVIEGRLLLLYPNLSDADEMLHFITQQLTFITQSSIQP